MLTFPFCERKVKHASRSAVRPVKLRERSALRRPDGLYPRRRPSTLSASGTARSWMPPSGCNDARRCSNLRQGFYVVVPPQYASWGAPPPAWYIDALMRREGQAYYVGLLKAAELHGATHQAVMEFQVVTAKRLPRIRAGRSLIVFHFRKDMKAVTAGIEDRKTDTGTMKVSFCRADRPRPVALSAGVGRHGQRRHGPVGPAARDRSGAARRAVGGRETAGRAASRSSAGPFRP